MNKSKWFALIISGILVSSNAVAYAQTYFDPPSLVVTKPLQPASSIAPSGALHVPFTNFDLTARGTDIVIDDITVVKTGTSDDAAFEDILLLGPDSEILGEGSLDDEHTVHFTEPIYIPRNTTLRLTVAVNMTEDLSEFEGQTAAFTVTDIASHGHVKVRRD